MSGSITPIIGLAAFGNFGKFCSGAIQYGRMGMAASTIALTVMAGTSVANAADAAAGGCVWRHDIELKIGQKRLTIEQAKLASNSEPLTIDGYQLFPLPDRLKIEVIGPAGDEWEIGLTQVDAGRRCLAFYAGNAVRVNNERLRGLR